MSRLDALKLDRRVKLQRREVEQDQYGAETETWVDIATVWAQRLELRGDERWQAQQAVATTDIKYRIRHLSGLSPMDRLVDGGRVFDIKAVLEIGRRDGLEIHAEARAE
jgi:SPP1 family predicted phage head-tail adaptor